MKTFKDLKQNIKKDASSLPEVKIALLGDTATQFLAIALRGIGYERGYNINLFESDYNQIERQIFDPTSDYHCFGADITVVFQSTHKLLEHYSLQKEEKYSSIAEERLNFVKTICELAEGKVIYFNYPEIDDAVFGSYASKVDISFPYQLRKLNYELMNLSQQIPNIFLCDLSDLQNRYGREWMFDSSIYMNTEMVLSIDSLPYIASRVMDIVCAIKGQIKKCLILDLDNTIWGGVVGDDGWENIQLGHGLGIGKAFTEFQQWIKKLKNRGIIVAICSKNDEDKAKEPFIKNPEMLLSLDDIAVFVANWENKADNIRTIRDILNIGYDSMVFLDDNPFERNIVRENLPEVCVPELPEDPADYLEYLYSLNLFETASYSCADTDRTKQYQVEAQRANQKRKYANETEFLKSLDMVSEVAGFNGFNIPRVAQLSQRSNQFNLRTIRYTEAEVENIGKNDRYVCFSFGLKDKFGDNGLICVVILEKIDEETLFINTWFMNNVSSSIFSNITTHIKPLSPNLSFSPNEKHT